MQRIIKFYLSLTIFFFSTQGFAQSQYLTDSLQSILDDAVSNGNVTQPGGLMEVSVPGQWTWTGFSGYAINGTTSGQPQALANGSEKFRCGSVSKVFMSTSIFKLQELGLLNISDTIDQYLSSTIISDTISSSDFVTIEHLLSHRSGIANSGDNTGCQTDVLTNPTLPYSLEEGVFCGASLGELFTPGTSYSYSNTNYTILAMIVESVTGDDYWTFLTDSILVPTGLSNTLVPSDDQIQTAHMGCYWNFPPEIDLTIIDPSIYKGWADVVTTVEDLNDFHDSLRNGAIISSANYNLMKTNTSTNYGLGHELYAVGGDAYTGHLGEVANTSGMHYSALSTTEYPNGYYISYNFSAQGTAFSGLIDNPVYELLSGYFTSLNETETLQINVYPNPSSEKLNIAGILEEVNLIISDVNGKELFSKTTSNDVILDISNFNSGLYFISVQSESGSFVERFVKN
jgi:D-alanyl-D-alanine carboxypeptidase